MMAFKCCLTCCGVWVIVCVRRVTSCLSLDRVGESECFEGGDFVLFHSVRVG